jgi:hypothetical protein
MEWSSHPYTAVLYTVGFVEIYLAVSPSPLFPLSAVVSTFFLLSKEALWFLLWVNLSAFHWPGCIDLPAAPNLLAVALHLREQTRKESAANHDTQARGMHHLIEHHPLFESLSATSA